MSGVRRLRQILLLGAAAAICISAPASAGTRAPLPPPGAFDIHGPVVPIRDVVRDYASAGSSRKLARAGIARYPVGDAEGRTVGISVTTLCGTSFLLCNAADPQTIATFLGTLAHGDEITSLNVQITTDAEIAAECGTGAQACYFPGQARMLISGNDTTGADGATREFVLAHEYGHHVANNRLNPPFTPTINYGTKRWATYERVCQGVRSGAYDPGAEQGEAYFRNPGEAFAESFAFNRFPDAPVEFAWATSLKPDAGAYAAITADTLDPWTGPVTKNFTRNFHRGGPAAFMKKIVTPLDGNLVLKLSGKRGSNLTLILRNSSGALLQRSGAFGAAKRIHRTVCGDRSFTATVKRSRGANGRFRLKISKP